MEKVYDLHQHRWCVIMHIAKKEISMSIVPNSNRYFGHIFSNYVTLDASITYNKHIPYITGVGVDSEEEDEEDIVIDNFCDRLYTLFKKDKETWDEEDKFLMKAVSDYLPLAVKETMKKMELETESFDLFHYAFVVPSEWEEQIIEDMIRPIFVQSGLISSQDHQDRLLFYTDIEAICYKHDFKRGDNTILCRFSSGEGESLVKFDLIQTTTSLFNFPNAKLFPKVMKSSSVSITTDDVQHRIKVFLRASLFPAANADDHSVKTSVNPELVPYDQDQIIEALAEGIFREVFLVLNNENYKKKWENRPWITFKKEWMLNENQKEFISSLLPSVIYAEVDIFLLDYMKDIILDKFTKSYKVLLVVDNYSNQIRVLEDSITWLKYLLEYNSRFLNYVTDPQVNIVKREAIMKGAGEAVFEAIQHSDIYCKPRIVPSADLSTSSSVFVNSKPDAIINLDISFKSTLLTCSILDEDGLIQHIFDHDYIIKDKLLHPLGHFYTFSDKARLNVRERFVPFAERYLLGDLSDLIADYGVSVRKDLLLEMKSILANDHSEDEVLISTNRQEYIKAFMLMYMIYIKEEILDNLLVQLGSDPMDMKIGYDVSIEAMLLNNTMEIKDDIRDIIYASGLVLKDDHSKKLRITTQGERILPAIQKSLKLELSLKSYFLLCQIHEDYLQLSLHQVVTEPSSEEKEQESIIVQEEVIPIQNICDSLCLSMWYNLLEDNSLIELCEFHNTNDNNKDINLFLPKVKAEFFANLKGHISNNVLQNNHVTERTNAVTLTSSCNCKVRLTTADIIDISFKPVLHDIACTLSASLLNKELFGNYTNIDYLFTFIRYNNNPQLQSTLAKILEEEADDFNLELGIDTSCLGVPELFNQLLQPFIAQQPHCYKDFRIGALQQVCNEGYVFNLREICNTDLSYVYKSKITDTETIECGPETDFTFLNKGDVINNAQSNRKFYLRNKKDRNFDHFSMLVYIFKRMNQLENKETLSCGGNTHRYLDESYIHLNDAFPSKDVDVPVMVSVRYVSYTSSFQFSAKIVGNESGGIIEAGVPLTLTRL